MKIRKYIIGLAACIGSLFLTACPESTAGIFSRVANEKYIIGNATKGLQKTSPSFVININEKYFAGIGSLWTKQGTRYWEAASISGVPGNAYASSGVADDTTLYVLFTNPVTGVCFGLYKSTDGQNWTQELSINDPLFDSEKIKMRLLLEANKEIFIVCEREELPAKISYSILHLQTRTFGMPDTSGIGMPSSIAFHGGEYWFTAGGYIYKGPANAIVKASGPDDWPATGTTPTTPLVPRYSGVCAADTGIIVSSLFGKLFYTGDGVSWTASIEYSDPNTKNVKYSFGIPLYLADPKTLLVPTNGKPRGTNERYIPVDGYLEFDLTGGFTSAMAPRMRHDITSNPYDFASSLGGKAVNRIVALNGGTKLFALTYGNGLWSNTKSGTSWSSWYKE